MEKFLDVKAYFKQNNLTYAKVGDMLGTSHVYVSNILNGKQELGKNGCRKWADTFGFSYYYLLTGEGSLFDDDKDDVISVAVDKDINNNVEPESASYWKGKYEGAMQQVQMLRELLEQNNNGTISQKSNVG